MHDEEIWKPIKDYEKILISNFGRAKNSETDHLYKFSDNGRGYDCFCTTINGKRKTFKIHREVGIAFVDNPDNLPIVDHEDSNKKNNHYLNLSWVTNSVNTKRAYNNHLIGKQNRLTKEERCGILDMKGSYSIRELAIKFECGQDQIRRLLKRGY